uniref:uncharacterized protein LOC108950844 n=1 Tax=Ciona intestinalis TaxID=7719 RepID=UPI000EF52D61|nr:uncharacterized protein LOC108950844 [Ciona intestinalis]|eukprot:XP_018672517.2 uncharacterized protein LOC108950844 [Ciona intestinalis]
MVLDCTTQAYVELEKVVLNKRLLKDIAQLSTRQQTSSLEAYNSLLLQFAPKLRAFSHRGMLCRHFLAALHYNENCGRKFLKRNDGSSVVKYYFPKYKKGEFFVRRQKEEATFGYVSKVLCGALKLDANELNVLQQQWNGVATPEFLSSTYFHPTPSQAAKSYYSRFPQLNV